MPVERHSVNALVSAGRLAQYIDQVAEFLLDRVMGANCVGNLHFDAFTESFSESMNGNIDGLFR